MIAFPGFPQEPKICLSIRIVTVQPHYKSIKKNCRCIVNKTSTT